ncbi:MAG: SpoIID/LytB domain-containing protein [Acidimicrobiales bacterium]
MRRPVSVLLSLALAATAAVTLTVVGAPSAAAQTSFTITGGGWGHGVGMSQYGAKGRADAGQSTTQILNAYYAGAAIEARSLAGPKVKLGDATTTEVAASGGAIYGTAEGGAPVLLAAPGQRLSIRMFGSAIIVQRVSPDLGPIGVLAASGRYYLTWDAGNSLSISATGRGYAYGRIKLVDNSTSFSMVLEGETMQQYLYGLGEMPASWHSEALRAQAIAGRSFAAYRLAHPQGTEFDMYASVSDQAYVGTTQAAGTFGANWVGAVDTTDAQVLTSGGQVIQAFYSSSNGGYTERSDYVFSATLPYLVATPDPLDQATGNPNFSWTRTYTGDELGAWLTSAGRGHVGSVTAVSIGGNVGASGRVDRATVTVTGTGGSTTMTGNQFRSAVNAGAASSRDLLSTKFAVSGPAAPVAPTDTTPPDLKVLVGTPMRFGSTGDICAFVMSDEVAITAIHVRIGGVDLRSRVGGVGPDFPQFLCINIPPKLRPKRAITTTLTGAALDAAVNLRFVQRQVTIAR